MNKIFMNALKSMLVVLISSMSEHIRSFMIEGAYKFYAYAKSTETTEYDDILAKFILEVLDLDVPES